MQPARAPSSPVHPAAALAERAAAPPPAHPGPPVAEPAPAAALAAAEAAAAALAARVAALAAERRVLKAFARLALGVTTDALTGATATHRIFVLQELARSCLLMYVLLRVWKGRQLALAQAVPVPQGHGLVPEKETACRSGTCPGNHCKHAEACACTLQARAAGPPPGRRAGGSEAAGVAAAAGALMAAHARELARMGLAPAWATLQARAGQAPAGPCLHPTHAMTLCLPWSCGRVPKVI